MTNHKGRTLKAKRSELGLTQQQAADKAEISIRQYQRFESDDKNIMASSFQIVCRVIEALEMDISDFYHGRKLDFSSKKAVYYSRVTIYDEFAVESEHITEYVEKTYPYIQKIYIERGTERLQLEKLLADAKNREFQLVIIKNISRLKRNVDVIVDVLDKLKESSVSVYFEDENIYCDGWQELIEQALAELAGEEARARSEAARRGWETRRRNRK